MEAVLPFHLNQTQVSRFVESSHCYKMQIVFYCFQLQLAEFMHVGSIDREDHPCTINTVYQDIPYSIFLMFQKERLKLRTFKQDGPQFMNASNCHLFLSLSCSLRTQKACFLPGSPPFLVSWYGKVPPFLSFCSI